MQILLLISLFDHYQFTAIGMCSMFGLSNHRSGELDRIRVLERCDLHVFEHCVELSWWNSQNHGQHALAMLVHLRVVDQLLFIFCCVPGQFSWKVQPLCNQTLFPPRQSLV